MTQSNSAEQSPYLKSDKWSGHSPLTNYTMPPSLSSGNYKTLPLQDCIQMAFFGNDRVESYSSDDESSDDDSHLDDKGQVFNNLASAIQFEFFRKSSKVKYSYKDYDPGTSTFGSLIRPVECEVPHSDPTEDLHSTEVSLKHQEEDNYLPMKPLSSSGTEARRSLSNQRAMTPAPDRPACPASSGLCKPPLPPADLPGDAGVLYCGSVQITSSELRDMDLTRPITTLYASSPKSKMFASLRFHDNSFTISDCDLRNLRAISESNDSQQSNPKRKEKKLGRKERRRGHSKEPLQDDQEKKKPSGIKSRMGRPSTSGTTTDSYPFKSHNDSLQLKSYDGMRKVTRSYCFEYMNVIYCGSRVSGAPDHILCWVYRIKGEKLTAVECFVAECNDKHHAELLSHALNKQIMKARGR